MPSEDEYIRRGFIAERRSLLVVSFILFFYQQAGLQIDKINVFGNEAKISDAWWVSLALWVLWGYFLLRAYQYLRGIPDRGFWTAYDVKMKESIRRLAFRRFKNSFVPEDEDIDRIPDFKISQVEFPMIFPKMWSDKLRVSVAYSWGSGGASGRSPSYTEDITGARLMWTKAKSVLNVTLSTHVWTEYVLPFMVALLPFANFLRRDFL